MARKERDEDQEEQEDKNEDAETKEKQKKMMKMIIPMVQQQQGRKQEREKRGLAKRSSFLPSALFPSFLPLSVFIGAVADCVFCCGDDGTKENQQTYQNRMYDNALALSQVPFFIFPNQFSSLSHQGSAVLLSF